MEIEYIEEFNGKYSIIKQVYDKKILVIIKEENNLFNFKDNKFFIVLSNHNLLELKASNFSFIKFALKSNPRKKLERNSNIYK